MLGFAPIAGRPLADGNGRRWTIIAATADGAASTAHTTARVAQIVASGETNVVSTATTSRFAPAAGQAMGASALTLRSIRAGGVAVEAAASAGMAVVGIHLCQLAVVAGGLASLQGIVTYGGRPGMQLPAHRPGTELRDADGDLLGAQRDADDVGPAVSRPAAESVVPASREATSGSRATSRRASGASASTQRSASRSGPALRRADNSIDPGRQR